MENSSLIPFPIIGDNYADYIPSPLEEEDGFSIYKKKKSHITEAEMVFYKALKEAVQDKYDIQRQVVLSSIIDVTSPNKIDYQTKRQFNPDRSRIDKKTVDFVLFDKETLEPCIAIELDDLSHQRPDRTERDGFINPLFKKINLSIIRIKNQNNYSTREIAALISNL